MNDVHCVCEKTKDCFIHIFNECINECIKPLNTNIPHNIEASQLSCNGNQLTDFCKVGNIGC